MTMLKTSGWPSARVCFLASRLFFVDSMSLHPNDLPAKVWQASSKSLINFPLWKVNSAVSCHPWNPDAYSNPRLRAPKYQGESGADACPGWDAGEKPQSVPLADKTKKMALLEPSTVDFLTTTF